MPRSHSLSGAFCFGALPQAGGQAPIAIFPSSDYYDKQVIERRISLRPLLKFRDLPIPQVILANVDRIGFVECTSIQEKTLPITLTGKDIAGQAQTGTGKTAAFLIALFSRLFQAPRTPRGIPAAPLALIVAPTRELAVQIERDALELAQGTDFRIVAVYGGMDYIKQQKRLEDGVDILIGTPGRLIDYFKQKLYVLKQIRIVVIDEADRMFDMGFIADLRFLLRRLPPYQQRQAMLFSATLGFRVMELAYEHMNNAVKITIDPEKVTVDQVVQVLYHVERAKKFSLLLGILKNDPGDRVLIFINTKRQGEILEERLSREGFSVGAITGDIPQKKRLRILNDFMGGKIGVLVATDVASRGLHIDAVTHVINYDLPQDAEDYVHRIGRTARAGAGGKAISLACEEYVYGLEAVEQYIGQKILVEWPPDDWFIHPKPRPIASEKDAAQRSVRSDAMRRRRPQRHPRR